MGGVIIGFNCGILSFATISPYLKYNLEKIPQKSIDGWSERRTHYWCRLKVTKSIQKIRSWSEFLALTKIDDKLKQVTQNTLVGPCALWSIKDERKENLNSGESEIENKWNSK